MINARHPTSPHIRLNNLVSLRIGLMMGVLAMGVGCEGGLATSERSSPGLMNGLMNGLFHAEGAEEYLYEECPLLANALLTTGDLTQSFSSSIATELALPACDNFASHIAALMVPYGQSLQFHVGTAVVASYPGAVGMEYLVQQVYPSYTFLGDAFLPAFPAAQTISSFGMAGLTNGIERLVSIKTNHSQMDAHRAVGEDFEPREFTMPVPFSAAALAEMAVSQQFLDRLPNLWKPCNWQETSFLWMQEYLSCLSSSPDPLDTQSLVRCHLDYEQMLNLGEEEVCPIPVVVIGNSEYEELDPGRTCRILKVGEEVPPEQYYNGLVSVPEGGCPLIQYAGRDPNVDIFDDASWNPPESDEGCDVNPSNPSELSNCLFHVIIPPGEELQESFKDHYVWNIIGPPPEP
jgi:hypothetical protein